MNASKMRRKKKEWQEEDFEEDDFFLLAAFQLNKLCSILMFVEKYIKE